MLVPSKTKYRKSQKGGKKILGASSNCNKISFGSFALKALESSRLNSKQIESARKVATKYMKRSGKIWIRSFPHIPVTQKPAEVRMGSGKGNVEYYMQKIKPGNVIFELDGVDSLTAIASLTKASAKLPFRTKIITII